MPDLINLGRELTGQSTPEIGLAVGVFDLLHRGHLSFLRAARHGCNFLIVGLQRNPDACKAVEVHHTYNQRYRRLELFRAIDRIVPYQKVDHLVRHITYDRLFLGKDQLHPGFCRAVDYCRCRDLPVICLPRTPGISSSALRQGLTGRFIPDGPPSH